MEIKVIHSGGLGQIVDTPSVLTDERSESSYGQMVLLMAGKVYGTGDAPLGYLHASGDYTEAQWARISAELNKVAPYEHRWHFGASMYRDLTERGIAIELHS